MDASDLGTCGGKHPDDALSLLAVVDVVDKVVLLLILRRARLHEHPLPRRAGLQLDRHGIQLQEQAVDLPCHGGWFFRIKPPFIRPPLPLQKRKADQHRKPACHQAAGQRSQIHSPLRFHSASRPSLSFSGARRHVRDDILLAKQVSLCSFSKVCAVRSTNLIFFIVCATLQLEVSPC